MRLFVSYKSTDRQSVQELVADLTDMGHQVWYDQELEGGEKWWDGILTHIRDCDALVFAMTPASLESRPCQLEYTYASALSRHIIPVRLDKDIQVHLLPVVLQERQIVDYTRRDKEAYKDLEQTLRSLPPTPALPVPLPAPPPIPISPLAPLKTQIGLPDLTFEQQVTLVHQLKGLLADEELYAGSRELLERLRDHPSLLASVMRDIDEALRIPAPKPQKKRKPAPPPPPRPVKKAEPAAPAQKKSGGGFSLLMILGGLGLLAVVGVIAIIVAAILLGGDDNKGSNNTFNNSGGGGSNMTAADYFNQGVFLANTGDPGGAINAYTLAIAINPNFKEAYYNRGLVYQSLGYYSAAQEDFAEHDRLLMAGY